MNFIKSKKQFVTTLCFSLVILFGITVSFTAIDNIVLHYVELFFHKTLRDPARWIDIIQNTSALCIFTLCVIYFLMYIDLGIQIKKEIQIALAEYKKNFFLRHNFFLAFGLIFFILLTYSNIIRANFFYADDLFRNYGGNRSWIGFSRYISEFCSIFIHNNLKLNDIAPLSQFIAIVIAAVTVLILSVALTESLKITSLLALVLIFIAPFYAENISYRFDAPYMSISLFFASVPFLFKKEKKTYICVSILSIILTCISYQAALPLYILSVIYLFIKDFLKKENFTKSFKFVLYSIISFVVALVIFKLFFMNKIVVEDDSYFSSEINICSLLVNCAEYIKQTFSLNGGFLTKLLFAFSIFLLLFNVTLSTKQNKLLTFAVVVLSIIVSYILSFGPYLVFEHPVFAARAFMGFNVFVAFIVLALFELKTNIKPFEKVKIVSASILIYSCVVFLFVYGNVLKNQNEYENFRIQLILNDLATCTDKTNSYTISFAGKLDLCEKNRIALKNYPLLKAIVPTRLGENSIWNEEYINGYNFKCEAKKNRLSDDYSLVKKSYYHDIFRHENDFIILLK